MAMTPLTEDQKKAKAAAKVTKLIALSQGKANEAEAMSAMAMARQLADEWGLTQKDIDSHSAATEDFVKSERMYSGSKADKDCQWAMADRFLWDAIAAFCSVKIGVAVSDNGKWNEVQYFGHRIDVEIAKALRKVINSAMNLEWMVYRDFVAGNLKTQAQKDSAEAHFTAAMSDRLRQRMRDLRQAEAEADESSTALVLSKMALVVTKAKEVGFKDAHGGTATRNYNFDQFAASAGRAAGDRVKLQDAVVDKGSRGAMKIASR